MNILPKKKWHVRTKENIARVRRDEKKAAEEEQHRLDRAILAENERRLQALRDRAQDRTDQLFGTKTERTNDAVISPDTGHVNLFQDLEAEERKNLGTGNKEYEEEKKKEQMQWESKMGIQVIFAEGTNEYDKKKSWYETIPRPLQMASTSKTSQYVPPSTCSTIEQKEHKKEKKRKRDEETSSSSSESENERKKRKHKRKRRSSSSSDDDRKKHKHKKSKKKKKKKHKKPDSDDERRYQLEKMQRLTELREERIRREREEKARTQELLHPELKKKKEEQQPKQKYNNMFNPEFARQGSRQ